MQCIQIHLFLCNHRHVNHTSVQLCEFRLQLSTVYILYTYNFLMHVIFEVFEVNWPSMKFSSSNCIVISFGLYQLESGVYTNGYVRHLQEMMVRFDCFTSGSQQGRSQKLSLDLSPNYTFQSILVQSQQWIMIYPVLMLQTQIYVTNRGRIVKHRFLY